MKELICPKCGTAITVDEAEYASILSQVKNQEFEAEITRREAEIRKQLLAEQNAEAARQASSHQQALSQKDVVLEQKNSEIAQLRQQLSGIEAIKKAEKENAVLSEQQRVQAALVAKDQEIAQLKSAAELQANQASLREKAKEEQFAQERKMLQEQVDYYKDMKTRMSTKMVGVSLTPTSA